MNKNLISVVMITYGHENYITQAIEGVLMQVCDFDVELIIANDCSPDNTDSMVKEIIDKHPKFHCIKYTSHEQNKGMMSNFIWALEQAKGKYIALCEGDDYWTDPLKLQKQTDFLNSTQDCSLSFHNATVLSPDGSKSLFNKGLIKKEYTGDEILKEWTIPTASIVFRNFLIEDYKLLMNKNILFPDILLFLLLAQKGKICCFDNVSMSFYRRHDGGVSFISGMSTDFFNKRQIHYKELNLLFKNKYNKTIQYLSYQDGVSFCYSNYKKLPIKSLFKMFKVIYYDPSLFLIKLKGKLKKSNKNK